MKNNSYYMLKRNLFVLIMFFSFAALNAQEINIKGTITDDTGVTIPGVNILIKGASTGTISDMDGNFRLTVPNNKTVIVVSFVGMKTQEIEVGNRSVLPIIMEVEGIGLDEVIAVGYGSVKKSDLSGSVSSIRVEDIGDKPITSVDQLLQGTAAGVNLSMNSGAPGASSRINIRGVSTINGSSQPLVVIDGFEMETENANVGFNNEASTDINPLANLNPNDIESIEVLKDASSTAIYGSRGANGVIIITTKQGLKGGKVTYNYRTDIAKLPKKIDMLGTRDYLEFRNTGYEDAGLPDRKLSAFEMDSTVNAVGNVNWQDEIFQTGISQDHSMSFLGGDDKSKYSVNLGYTDVNGIIINSGLQRYSLRSNLSKDMNKWLKIHANLSYNRTESDQVQHSSKFGTPSTSVVLAALFTRPIFSDGPTEDAAEGEDLTFQDNPVTIANKVKNKYLLENTIGKFGYDVKLFKGLTYKGSVNFSSYKSVRQTYFPRGTSKGDATGGTARFGEASNLNYGLEQLLSYNGKLARGHRLSAVLGATYRAGRQETMRNEAANFINDNLEYNYMQGASVNGKFYTYHVETELASLLGRLNYTLKDKYIATFTGRYDGTSRLKEKWSFFPSGAFAWRVNQEDFLKDVSYLSNFKIRTSYGISGRQSVRPLAGKTVLASNTAVVGESWGTAVLGSSQGSNGQLGNPNLKWETTAQLNIGTDISFVDNRYRLTFDWFKKNTTNLLLSLPLAYSDGYPAYWTNLGEIENKGFEVEIGANIIDKQFKWDVSATYSSIHNKILDLGSLDKVSGGKWINSGGIALNQPLHVAKVGHEVGAYFGYQFDGIFQTPEEVAAGAQPDAVPGDWKVKDIAGAFDENGNAIGDGKITPEDQTIIGSATPDFVFGIGNNFSYRNFSLSVFVSGSYGNEVLNLNRYVADALATEVNRNIRQEAYDNRWQGEGTSNEFSRVHGDGNLFNVMPNDSWIEDGSFIRLKNVSLSYNIPLKSKSYVSAIRVFANGTNLFVLTNYSGYDPEVSARNSALEPGVDFGVFPQSRVFSFGASIDF